MERGSEAYGLFRSEARPEVVVSELKSITEIMAQYSDIRSVNVVSVGNRGDRRLDPFIEDAKERGLNYMLHATGNERMYNIDVANDLVMFLNQASQLPEMMMPTEYGSGRIIYEENGQYLDR